MYPWNGNYRVRNRKLHRLINSQLPWFCIAARIGNGALHLSDFHYFSVTCNCLPILCFSALNTGSVSLLKPHSDRKHLWSPFQNFVLTLQTYLKLHFKLAWTTLLSSFYFRYVDLSVLWSAEQCWGPKTSKWRGLIM